MSEKDAAPPGPPDNPWNRWNAHIAMKLAYWAYPHEDEKKARELAEYPPPWEHAKAGVHLPADWQEATYICERNGESRNTVEGWNTQHNANGKLENQFKVSINPRTQEISFDFKGSDAWSNWVSDLGNAGASEFARIQAQAQAAFDYLSKHPDYKNFHFTATGHSLGGGMAQSFALKNNLDVAVYNSLPIARDTIKGDYFKDVGGYDKALALYKASHHTVHDVRTPNDIATYYYQDVWQNQYLSKLTGKAPTQLPGPAVPDLLKTVLVASKAGTLPALALMGMDHTMGSLVQAQNGLSVRPDGSYRIPEGHQDFSEIPLDARKRFALISASPVTKVDQVAQAEKDFPFNRYDVQREDGSHQFISINTRTGEVDIEHYGADGQRLKIELNAKRGGPATFIELDAEGHEIRREQVAMGGPAPTEAERDTQVASGSDARYAGAAAHEPSRLKAPPAPAPDEHPVLAQRFKDQLGPRLAQLGMSEPQIETLAAAAFKEAMRYAGQGDVSEFLLRKDGAGIAMRQESGPVREFGVSEALQQSAQEHRREATTLSTQQAARSGSLPLWTASAGGWDAQREAAGART